MRTAAEIVAELQLEAHPEGGWYKETYRSDEKIAHLSLPLRFGGDRSFSTAIYFLLPAGVFSAFHRIQSDECWHFYEGLPLNIYVIHRNRELQVIRLGSNIGNGETFQAVVPAGSWFASAPVGEKGYTLTGCTVAPGFDFTDFEMAVAEELSMEFPEHDALIRSLCR